MEKKEKWLTSTLVNAAEEACSGVYLYTVVHYWSNKLLCTITNVLDSRSLSLDIFDYDFSTREYKRRVPPFVTYAFTEPRDSTSYRAYRPHQSQMILQKEVCPTRRLRK